MSTPEDRLWSQLFDRLGRIENKLDRKIDYQTHQDARRELMEQVRLHRDELDERIDELGTKIDELSSAAITPDQVAGMISSGLKEADAQGLTRKDRLIRWMVAGASILTFLLLVYDRWSS